MLSIIIADHDNVDILQKCLHSLYQSDYLDFEILVSYFGKNDISHFASFPRLRVIPFDQPFSYPVGINRALEQAKGDYFVVMHSDVLLLPNTLSQLVQVLNTESQIEVLGCQLVSQDGSPVDVSTTFPSVVQIFSLLSYLEYLTRFIRHIQNYFRISDIPVQSAIKRVDYVSGLIVLKRTVYTHVLGLNEQNFLTGHEMEWQLRLGAAKHAVWQSKNIVAVHLSSCRFYIQPKTILDKADFWYSWYKTFNSTLSTKVTAGLLVVGLYIRSLTNKNQTTEYKNMAEKIFSLAFSPNY